MIFRTLLFALSILPYLLQGTTAASFEENIYSKGPPPSWVKKYDFPLTPIDVKPSQVNLQYLLIDTQRHWEKKTTYCHYAVKALTQSGVEDISTLHIDFAPSHRRVVVHCIRVFREGQWLDRLESSLYHLLQREKELENNLYNGDLSLVYLLGDIRKNDIIEYSYSIVGATPIFDSYFTDCIYLQWKTSIEQVLYRFLAPPDLVFSIRPINTTVEPKIVDLSPSMREWTWEAMATPPYVEEPDEPIWYSFPSRIQLSQYKTWQEFAKHIAPLYTPPKQPSAEMKALVDTWKEMTQDPRERALLALRFVQDEVRYFGLEKGIRSYVAHDPQLVFERRFGDCKDKAFLLHALLQLMDISSTPALVHSTQGKRLNEELPRPFTFNHVVLHIQIGEATYWVDPTDYLQGGSLLTTPFPNYHYALLLSKNATALTPLLENLLPHPTEIDTSYLLTSEDSATLTIKKVFHGFQADNLRKNLARTGTEEMSKNQLTEMQKRHVGVIQTSPLHMQDDRESNTFTLIESYTVPTYSLPDKKTIELFPYTTKNYLDGELNPNRASPYSLYYPLWVKEHIHIENPFYNWTSSTTTSTHEHESVFYTHSSKLEGHSADFYFELKHVQDHLPHHSLQEYWNMANEIKQNAPFDITITSTQTTPPLKASTKLYYFLPVILIGMIGLIIWQKRKHSTKEQLMLPTYHEMDQRAENTRKR